MRALVYKASVCGFGRTALEQTPEKPGPWQRFWARVARA